MDKKDIKNILSGVDFSEDEDFLDEKPQTLDDLVYEGKYKKPKTFDFATEHDNSLESDQIGMSVSAFKSMFGDEAYNLAMERKAAAEKAAEEGKELSDLEGLSSYMGADGTCFVDVQPGPDILDFKSMRVKIYDEADAEHSAGITVSDNMDIDLDGTVSTLRPLSRLGQWIKSTDEEYEKSKKSVVMKADLSKIHVVDLGIDHKNDTDLMFIHPIRDSLSVYKTVREDTAERDSESKVGTISSSHKWRDAHEAFKARNKKILEAVDEALEKDDLFDIK